jgi:acetyl-CoA C-acetyltransferase
MHAIAQMVGRLRAQPGALGLVTANGGFLSKYSVGIYSTRPGPTPTLDNESLQAKIDAWPAPPIAPGEGEGVVETYTVDCAREAPVGIVIGRLSQSGARFVARTDPDDLTLAKRMLAEEPLGAQISVSLDAEGRAILTAFEPAR